MGYEKNGLHQSDLRLILQSILASKDIVYNTDFLPGNKFLVTSDSAGQIKIFDSVQYELKAQTPVKG